MTCRAVQQRLGSYVDGELAAAETRSIRSHLASCPECRAALDEQNVSKLFVANLSAPEPSADFEERLVGKVMGTGKQKTFRWQPALAVVAMAAALLVFTFQYRESLQRQTEAKRMLERQNFEVARHQSDIQRGDPLMGGSGLILVGRAE
ncbi:MAG: zf-HC2 domain-containing protein [Armatimonadetes bacterium]|nr:zf-HC2 domain-containing protein [Armatimonadota bacterium]